MINVILIVPFSLVWAPLRMQYAKNENNRVFVQKVTSYFLLLGMFFIFLATIFSDVFMNLFFTNKNFAGANMVFPITMLATLTFGLQNIFDFGIYFHKKLHFYIIISAIGLLFNVVMNYLFIPHFGYIAAAYVTLFTYLLTTSLIYIVSNRYYKIGFDWKRMIIPFVIVISGYFLVHNTNFFQENELSKKIFILILTVMLIVKYWLRLTEKEQVIGLFRKLFS
jgi:O-antigen/teichoic acid export membrane protein